MDNSVSAVDYPELYRTARVWAIVGYSDKPERAGHFVPAYLRQQGYQVIAVNPKFAGEVDGLACYPSLAAIPEDTPVDVIDIFRAPQYLPEVLADTLAMAHRPRWFWMQPGAENEAVAAEARAAGLTPLLGTCALAVHRELRARGAL